MTERKKLIDFLFPFLCGGGIGLIVVSLGRGAVFHRLSDGFSLAGVLLLAKRCFALVKSEGGFRGIRYVADRIKEQQFPFYKADKKQAGKEREEISEFQKYGEWLAGIVYLVIGGGFLFFV